MVTRRNFTMGSLTLGAGFLTASAWAQDTWPTRRIRFIVPFPPGGANDVIGRVMADKFSKAFGEVVFVDNRPGAGGTLGALELANAKPDGYTIMIGYIGNLGYAPTIYSNLAYDPMTSFAPISLVANLPAILVVNPSLPVRSVKDLIEYTKKNPDRMAYSSGGNGTGAHIGMAYLCHETGMKMVHVPYRGTAPSLLGLISDQVQVTMAAWPGIGPFVKSGQLRAIGVSSTARVPFAPNIPTIAESGVPGFDMVEWYGIFAPANTPTPIVNRLNTEIAAALESPETLKYLTNEGALPSRSSPAELQAYMRSEIGRWRNIIIAAGIKSAS